MSDEKITEKIYCYDHPSTYNNHDALYAALLNNRNNCCNQAAEMAMLNGGGGFGNWNNPFVYLIWMMFANRFFGGNGWDMHGQNAQNIEVQGQLQDIRTQMQNNQNSNLLMDAIKGNGAAISQLASNLNCDFQTLNGAICDVRGGIDRLSGQVGFSAERVINAINMGNCNMIQALKDCCCQTQKEILKLGSDVQLQNCQQTNILRNGQRDLGVAIAQGFAQTAYETQKQTCDIINAGNANTQRIIDTLNTHWSNEQAREIQDLKNENSNLKQTQYLAKLISGNNCGCGGCGGCGNGCGL